MTTCEQFFACFSMLPVRKLSNRSLHFLFINVSCAARFRSVWTFHDHHTSRFVSLWCSVVFVRQVDQSARRSGTCVTVAFHCTFLSIISWIRGAGRLHPSEA